MQNRLRKKVAGNVGNYYEPRLTDILNLTQEIVT